MHELVVCIQATFTVGMEENKTEKENKLYKLQFKKREVT